MAQKISKNFSHIGENIKKIRQAKKISQADFAQLFNLARPSVGAYEEGRSEPKIETLIQIANHFRISIDVLLTRKLTVSEIFSFGLVNKKLDEVHPVKTSDSASGSEIPLIRITHYLEYIVNIKKADYLGGIEKIKIPVENGSKLRAFEMNGSEMEYQQQGLHHQDLLICKKVNPEKVDDLINQIIIIVHPRNITTRRLKNVNSSELILKADDPNYPDIHLNRNEIIEIWKAEGVYTTYLNPPSRLEERILKIEEELKKLKD